MTPPSERRGAEGTGGPLRGVRVLDLTRGMPGALTTMMLADYGAEVVMVENPAGAPLRRTHGHSMWNRGKRSVAADHRRRSTVSASSRTSPQRRHRRRGSPPWRPRDEIARL